MENLHDSQMPFLEGNVERKGTPKRKLGKLARKKTSERLTANSVPEKISTAYQRRSP
jgi:hypothetical protein